VKLTTMFVEFAP